MRESTKFHHMLAFAESLPAIRAKVQAHLALRGLPREKVLAAVVRLLDATLIRVGSDEYARSNKSFGLTTLKNRHVSVDGPALRFSFKGKSGKVWNLSLRDRRIAKVMRACQDIPGQELFAYVDDAGKSRDVTLSDVNDYLRENSGKDITAKGFRTWHGTVLAAIALREFEKFDSEAGAKRNIRNAIERVAARLGNTPTICRKCYIHPEILASYAEGSLLLEIKGEVEVELREQLTALCPEEAAVLTLLQGRLSKTLKDSLELGELRLSTEAGSEREESDELTVDLCSELAASLARPMCRGRRSASTGGEPIDATTRSIANHRAGRLSSASC